MAERHTGAMPHDRLVLPGIAAGVVLTAVATGQDIDAEPNIEPARLVEPGDGRNCIWKLKEPTLDGQQVGDLEVVAVATIGADGKVVAVAVPSLETMAVRSWAKSRVQRWANCVVKAMRFEPGRQRGEPVESTVSIPLKSWSEAVIDRPLPRQSVPAQLRSTPDDHAAAYRECVRGEVAAEHRMLYQFSVDEDGKPQGVKVLDSGADRDANRMGHCVIENLEFEPHVIDGRYARVPVHWSVVISPQGND